MGTEGIRIGKIYGITIKLHYSWFIIFILVTWSLSANYFPFTFPAWGLTMSITAGIITSLLFFGSVLAHEMMHSIVAKKIGIPVNAITLFIFGGVSQLEEEPHKPQDEFQMAIAGPLTSLILGGIFLAIWFWLTNIPEMIRGISFWLGWINVFLAGFNLIPGFPLDGGRVLRSLIWWQSNNLSRATKIASYIGRVIGYIFIFIGIWFIFLGDWFNGLWLALIGWFLQNAAGSSYQQMAIQNILKGHTAKEAMMTDCPTVSPGTNVEQLIHGNILTSGRRCFTVVGNEKVIGLLTMHNIKTVPRDRWVNVTVNEVMTPFDKVKKVGPDDNLYAVLTILIRENINQVLVVQNGNTIGMVARESILNFLNIRSELGI